jgi:hypothetical protein
MAAATDEPQDAPLLRIVNADATPEEVAALVAVIAALGSRPAEEKPKPRSTWADPARRMRNALPHGPGAWRSSGLPH